MLLHGAQSPSHALDTHALEMDQHQHQQARQLRRKRKAESQDNERLSKRLSLLNLGKSVIFHYAEKNGQKLYVPVENPSATASSPSPQVIPSAASSTTSSSGRHGNLGPPSDEVMQLDDSKYKVYIYDIDDELSSSESEPDEGKLVFLPDIEKHLRASRIPPSILANDQGELAGMQVVLYNEPTSLTVPREQDSVRKAIVEARARMREKQRLEREGRGEPVQMPPPFVPQQTISPTTTAESFSSVPAPAESDPDAMDMD
ncbi:uncharacterized protein CTRU02_209885 [Colletotrichum truncatum]|uniref:Uncharacterized protein n=1 Tax=Colletotrichum truncatum TaxID=5467 RepID=A0ACC3YTQ9_COLTU|nr:uncharacterized protein CTRU02_02456 [Colletotrichum truncatum]KAF6798482.1 hypothetical protein CTRU02_02456 [Colletotrichum truncatum]